MVFYYLKRRTKLEVVAACGFILWCSSAIAAPATNLVYQLLDQYVSAPDWREQPAERLVPVEFKEPGNEDAPHATTALLKKWESKCKEYRHSGPITDDPELTPAIQNRLLEGCTSHPEYLPILLDVLIKSSATYDSVFSILQKNEAQEIYTQAETDAIKQWLMVRSKYFRDDLVREAKSIHFDGEYLQKEEALQQLSELDWDTAKPLLEINAQNNEPHVSTYALCLLYKYATPAEEAPLRKKLQLIISDEKAPDSSRGEACDSILESDWAGKDEWFLSLLSILPNLKEGYTIYQPLENHVASDPDKWIPIITKYVGSTDRKTHDRAVSCLIQFHLKKARADALRPLLPWLGNPKWSSARDRLRLIQSLDLVDLPESVEGLMWVAEHEHGYRLSGAADALAKYNAKEAIPILKSALTKEKERSHRRNLIAAIHQLNGFSDDEIVSAIETFATNLASTNSEQRRGKVWWTYHPSQKTNEALLGHYMSSPEEMTDRISEHLLERTKKIEKQKPLVANILTQIALSGSGKESGKNVLANLSKPELTLETVLSALNHREELREHLAEELKRMAAGNGWPAAIATVILADLDGFNQILRGDDRAAQTMLLACARIVRQDLPIAQVARLFDQRSEILDLAVERYLVVEDSAEARAIVLARHPEELRILGALQSFDPGHFSFQQFSDLEGLLQQLLRNSHPPDEVYALLSAGYWGDNGQLIVSVYDGKGLLTVLYGNDRMASRDLSADEFKNLRTSIIQNKIDTLAPLNSGVFDGIQYEYIHLSENGGRRVYMNNPHCSLGKAPIYYHITELFQKLEATGKLSVHYGCENEIDGLTVLLSGLEQKVVTVCNDSVLLAGDDDKPLQWYRLIDGKLGDEVPQPAECRIIGSKDDIPKTLEVPDHLSPHPWKSGFEGDVIRPGYIKHGKSRGLWRCRKGEEPVLLCEGRYAYPMVSPDGKWVVAAKTKGSWASPNRIFRYDLHNNKEHMLNIPSADNLNPIAYIPSHNKILLERYPDTKERDVIVEHEYYLLNPETGESEIVKGDFRPWEALTYRPLQPAQKKGHGWAALPDRENGGTTIGLYDMKKFAFDPLMSVPYLRFDSMDMWVDEDRRIAYIAINGDLLRMPLKRNQT